MTKNALHIDDDNSIDTRNNFLFWTQLTFLIYKKYYKYFLINGKSINHKCDNNMILIIVI